MSYVIKTMIDGFSQEVQSFGIMTRPLFRNQTLIYPWLSQFIWEMGNKTTKIMVNSREIIGTRAQNGVRARRLLDACHSTLQVSLPFFGIMNILLDIPFSDIPEIAWDCSSLSTCSDLFPLVDCSYSITTNPDFDTHSELGYKHNKVIFNINVFLTLSC